MKWFAKTLWDLIAPERTPHPNGRAGPPCPAASSAGNKGRSTQNGSRQRTPLRARYDAIVIEMKKTYGIRVRKWRNSSTGCAWEVHYANGSTARLIESPYPKGPMSLAIFLHEIGHHAIGFKTYKLRCLEEYHAWKWSLDTMRERGFNVTEAVERRMAESLHYAIAKARRRGLRELPVELMPYVERPRKGKGSGDRHQASGVR